MTTVSVEHGDHGRRLLFQLLGYPLSRRPTARRDLHAVPVPLVLQFYLPKPDTKIILLAPLLQLLRPLSRQTCLICLPKLLEVVLLAQMCCEVRKSVAHALYT